MLGKQKYERALNTVNSGIEENKYDPELYTLRSKVKTMLGDKEGAVNDQEYSIQLADETMSIIDITAMGVRKTVKLMQSTTTTTKIINQ